MRPDTLETRIIEAALHILAQGEELLECLPAETFGSKMPAAFNASIGGHYRHCLDHFISFERALALGLVDYDARDRDPGVETNPGIARELTRRLITVIEAIPREALLRPVSVRTEVSYTAGDPPVMQSTLGRELAYVIAHSIHHYALIAVMARLVGLPLVPSFGMAPSTVAYERTLALR